MVAFKMEERKKEEEGKKPSKTIKYNWKGTCLNLIVVKLTHCVGKVWFILSHNSFPIVKEHF